jgi:hypothetical protein
MLLRGTFFLIIVSLVILNVSCAKIEEEQPVLSTVIILEKVPQADSIPSAWGKLIFVSSVPNFQNWALLWFQDDEGNIRMVPYNVIENRLSTEARLIRRS